MQADRLQTARRGGGKLREILIKSLAGRQKSKWKAVGLNDPRKTTYMQEHHENKQNNTLDGSVCRGFNINGGV